MSARRWPSSCFDWASASPSPFMKPPLPSLHNTARAQAPIADTDVFRQGHPVALEFARGVEVVEVLDSLPGKLLELFQPAEADKG